MPTQVNNSLAAAPKAATQLLKPKEAAIGSTDFSSQLKDAQQAQDKPVNADTAKPVRRETGKATRSSTKSKSTARVVRRRASDETAPEDATSKATVDSTKVVAANPSANDSTDAPTDGASDKTAADKPAPVGVPQIDPSSAVTPAVVRQSPPASVIALRNARLEEMREHSRIMTPYAGGAKVESAGTQEAPTSKTSADAAAGDLPTASKPGKTTEAPPADAGVEALPQDPVSLVAAKTVTKFSAAQTAVDSVASAANLVGDASSIAAAVTPDTLGPVDPSAATDAVASLLSTPANAQHSTANKAPAADSATPTPRETQFAEANHTNIVSALRTNLLPHGGTMEIRLDPPELGALQVTVEMRNGTINATFQTSNDDATRLLGHSLSQLKTALESQGVTVDKIQVQQAPRDQKTQGDSSQQQQRDDSQARQDQQREQQRQEMLQRMWLRISGAPMPVDLVA